MSKPKAAARKPAKARALPTHHSRWSMPPSVGARAAGVGSATVIGPPSDPDVVRPEPVPERLHAVEHLGGAGEEPLLVEPRLRERLGQLVVGVGGVLVLDLVVPRPEGEGQLRALALLERLEPGDELLPEPGGRPVLDRVARALGDRRVLGAVDARAARRRRTAWTACRGGACRGRRSRGRAARRSAAATRSGRHRSGTGRRRRCPRWRRARGRCRRPRGRSDGTRRRARSAGSPCRRGRSRGRRR